LKPSLNSLRNSLREPSLIEFDSNRPRQIGALRNEDAGRLTMNRHAHYLWKTRLRHTCLSEQK
jgi:hypothetical protein